MLDPQVMAQEILDEFGPYYLQLMNESLANAIAAMEGFEDTVTEVLEARPDLYLSPLDNTSVATH
jgi:hypothetical protein